MTSFAPIADRLSRFRQSLADQNGSAMLISNAANIYYLTGFRGLAPDEREAILMITPENAWLCLPRMYAETGGTAEGVSQKQVQLVMDDERVGLFRLAINQLGIAGVEANPGAGVNKRLLVEETDLRLHEFAAIKHLFTGPVKPVSGVVEDLRVIKDDHEKQLIRSAVRVTDQVFERITSYLSKTPSSQWPTESELIHLMRGWATELGGEGFGFDPIVAVGAGSSQPHYQSGSRRLTPGNPLLIDMGVVVGGYTGDLTRTLYLGKADDQFRRYYQTVHDCCRACIADCRPGIQAQDLHQKSVALFASMGLDQYYLHGLGHGVGLAIHEEPFFRPSRSNRLEPGMVVTIEPGLYWSGEYGIRIEEYVLITTDGAEVLSRSNADLTEIL